MPKLAIIPIAAFLAASIPPVAASSCDSVIAATMKVMQVSSHMYMTEIAGFTGGKTRNAETIYLNGVTYVKVNGPWRKSPISPQQLADAKKDSDQKNGTCAVVRDEFVNGEPATFYKVHSKSTDDTVDTQIWVSKLSGLPLKQINDIDAGGGATGKSHTEIRYEYSNVTAPAVFETPRR